MHFNIHKILKELRILRPKSVRGTLVIRANKEFDIAFWVFWTFPGSLWDSVRWIFKPRWLLTIFRFESQLMQMPSPKDIVIYRPGPGNFQLCKNPGTGHIFRCKSPGMPERNGNQSNWYLHNICRLWIYDSLPKIIIQVESGSNYWMVVKLKSVSKLLSPTL